MGSGTRDNLLAKMLSMIRKELGNAGVIQTFLK